MRQRVGITVVESHYVKAARHILMWDRTSRQLQLVLACVLERGKEVGNRRLKETEGRHYRGCRLEGANDGLSTRYEGYGYYWEQASDSTIR
jgi:hypothetical protein